MKRKGKHQRKKKETIHLPTEEKDEKRDKSSEDSLMVVPASDSSESDEEADEKNESDEENDDQEQKEDPLRTIYQDDETGKKIDMTKLDRKRLSKSAIGLLTLFGGIVVAGAAYAGFLFFNPDQTPINQEEAGLRIEIPEKVLSGEELTLTFAAQNNSRVNWSRSEIVIRFPDGWIFLKSDPLAENGFNNAWKFGPINGGGKKTLTITGQLIGEISATKTLEASLIYTPSNFQSEFKKTMTQDLNIEDSIIAIEMDGPEKVVQDQDVTYTTLIQNRSNVALQDLQVRMELPDQLMVESIDPEREEDQDKFLWMMKKFEAGEEKKILIHGKIQGSSGSKFLLKTQAGFIENETRFKPQQEATLQTQIISPDFNLGLSLNGTKDDLVVGLGERLEYRLSYRNGSELVYKDVEISLRLDGFSNQGSLSLMRWEEVKGVAKDQINGNVVTWTKRNESALTEIKPDQSGTLSFEVPLLSSLPENQQSVSAIRLESTAKVSNFEAEELEDVDVNIESKTLTAKVSSSFQLSSEARYYTEEFEELGDGPLPPIVGQTTSYRIFFTLGNGLNDLTDVVVSATLPSFVKWEEDVEQTDGAIKFDQKNQTVTWRLPRLSARTGTRLPSQIASFRVSISPKQTDLGKSLDLTHKVVAAGRDVFTDQKLTDENPGIDTELENDLGAQGKGVVVSP